MGHVDEEFHIWHQLQTGPPLQPLLPHFLPTTPSTASTQRVVLRSNQVDPRCPHESVSSPSPLFGSPNPSTAAAESSFMPIATASTSVPTAYDVSSSVDAENGQNSRAPVSTMSETNPADVEKPYYGPTEGGMVQVSRDQGPANAAPISCKCGNPDSWESCMVECSGPGHRGGRWFHLRCAGLTVDTIPDGKPSKIYRNGLWVMLKKRLSQMTGIVPNVASAAIIPTAATETPGLQVAAWKDPRRPIQPFVSLASLVARKPQQRFSQHSPPKVTTLPNPRDLFRAAGKLEGLRRPENLHPVVAEIGPHGQYMSRPWRLRS